MEEAVLVGNGEDIASDSVASTPGAQAIATKAAMEATTCTIRAFTEILPSVFTVGFRSSPEVDTKTSEHQKIDPDTSYENAGEVLEQGVSPDCAASVRGLPGG